MAQVKSFKIKKGTKIGGYKIQGVFGRGWEGEVYLCTEGATGAQRAIKLFPTSDGDEIAYVMHYAWFLEEISNINIAPRYYHMGIEFDYEIYRFGFSFIIQELCDIDQSIPVNKATEKSVLQFREKLKAVHSLGYALGDWDKRNQYVDTNGEIRKIDLDPGDENTPNSNINEDIDWFNKTFGNRGISF